MRASTILCFVVVASLFVAVASLQQKRRLLLERPHTRLHEEAGAPRKEKLPWWWDTDYMRSKRRRPIHN
ncbi:hypothetical protein GQ55_3G351700 [Panicum hallii var. hallii]|uniref:Uncharacterized protein n=2 Tax=Panicum hallii TaxID=206008 RepID=A0A2T7EFW3_9POAL|nr:hypothetical protein PAHAL_3G367500 [Panicum hallii]PUZ66716.1 hypothetical protein GQ55_3G351700 [Panicum hallii var. hallii]